MNRPVSRDGRVDKMHGNAFRLRAHTHTHTHTHTHKKNGIQCFRKENGTSNPGMLRVSVSQDSGLVDGRDLPHVESRVRCQHYSATTTRADGHGMSTQTNPVLKEAMSTNVLLSEAIMGASFKWKLLCTFSGVEFRRKVLTSLHCLDMFPQFT